MKKILIILLLFLSSLNIVVAEDTVYEVVIVLNNEYKVIESSDNEDYINEFYNENVDEYENLILKMNDKILKMEYGIVSFHSTDKCDYNVEFLNVNYKSSGYLNGCYGNDAAYVKTDEGLSMIDFEISGTYGRVDIDEVDLIPIELIVDISNYQLIDGEFFHLIIDNPLSDQFISMINLGDAPEYIKEGAVYYSYDGHYFYENIKQMLSDYIDLHYFNSVNPEQPYYNYYMYLSHRSYSNYNIEDLKGYIEDYLMIDSSLTLFKPNYHSSISDVLNQSQYYDNMESFIQFQYQYGSNAMMMLSLSMNETAVGRSSLSYRRNNLFGHAAYDSEVEANAKRYFNVSSSIQSHAKIYISKIYTNNEKFQYKGGYFGNKDSGMNVSYASDPYWGEKAASYFYQLDKVLGFKDKNHYCIGISNDFDKVKIYDESFNVIYKNEVNNIAFILLEETENYYKIQYETSFDNIDYIYDFELNTAFVLKEDIDYILNKDKLDRNNEFVEVVFDANEGEYSDGSKKVIYKLPEEQTAVSSDPFRKGYIFIGYNYFNVAEYQKINGFKLVGDYKTDYYLNDYIDLTDMTIEVETNNGVYEVPVNSSMIDNVIMTETGKQEISINFQDNILKFYVNISDLNENQIFEKIKEEVSELIELSDLSDDQQNDLFKLVSDIKENKYNNLSNDEIRMLDALLFKYDTKTNYQIEENNLDLSISGLNIATYAEKNLPLINDNLIVEVNEISDENLNKIVVNNGYDSYNQFTLTFKRNNDFTDISNDILVSVRIPDNENENKNYFVFEEINGNVIRLKTDQTDNYIYFRVEKNGTYQLASKNTLNEVKADDIKEVLRSDNSEANSFESLFKLLYILVFIISILIIVMVYIKRKRK